MIWGSQSQMIESLRDMRLFVAAYEERSFTAAAERENATQSGVSQHIRKIEERFGVRLFSRGGGAVSPTPAGDSYYRACIEVLRVNEAANRAVMRYGIGLDGEMVVGLMPTMTRSVLAPALAAFVAAHPNVVVRIVESFSATLTQQVQAGDLDFAIVPITDGIIGIKSRRFARTPEVLVADAARGLPHMAPLRLADLGPLKIVVPSRLNARRAHLEAYFAANGVQVERLLELDAMLGALDFVARTDFVAVVPGLMMAADAQMPEPRRLTVHPLADPPLAIDLVLIEPARRPLSPAAAAFLAVLEQEALAHNDLWPAQEFPDA